MNASPGERRALGVLLYCLLCRGELPFVGKDAGALHTAIREARPALPAGLSASARDLLGRMLAKDPRTRLPILSVRAHAWVAACARRGVLSSRDPMVAVDYSADMAHLVRAAA